MFVNVLESKPEIFPFLVMCFQREEKKMARSPPFASTEKSSISTDTVNETVPSCLLVSSIICGGEERSVEQVTDTNPERARNYVKVSALKHY